MATITMPVQVELCGRRLKRTKYVEVSDLKGKAEVMHELMDFWAKVTVIEVSEERQSKFDGAYRSVLVKFQNGMSGHVIGYDIRNTLARLAPGQQYNFEGYEQKGASLMLICMAVVTGKLEITPAGVDVD